MDPKQLIERAVQAWQSGDETAFWKLLAEDVHYEVIGTTRASGTYEGRKAFFREALLPMGQLLAKGAIPTDYDIIAEGDRVVLMWTGRGVMLNGAPYNNSYCWVLRITDNQISSLKAYLDTALVDALFDQQS